MTPEEKAKELVNDVNEELRWCIDDDSIDYSKTCALLTCNEILKFTIHERSDLYYNFENYWKEVKEEINKL